MARLHAEAGAKHLAPKRRYPGFGQCLVGRDQAVLAVQQPMQKQLSACAGQVPSPKLHTMYSATPKAAYSRFLPFRSHSRVSGAAISPTSSGTGSPSRGLII